MIWQELKRAGVLGINARIRKYMAPLNQRPHYPLVDDKLKTVELARHYGVSMPETYAVFDNYGDLKQLGETLKKYPSFVVKPARGAKGNGIILITQREDGFFIRGNGARLSLEALRYHILQIIGGLYSIGSFPDRAIIQYKIELHAVFSRIVTVGVPDVRVIVYRGFPIMAMTRLPTHESSGRANLHQGAVGAGLEMKSGRVIHAIQRDHIITQHPDTLAPLAELQVPYWQELLTTACQCYDMTEMGYLGVDLVLDAGKGPMVLEMNARPGLSIQIANRFGLLKILRRFEDRALPKLAPGDRAAWAWYEIHSQS